MASNASILTRSSLLSLRFVDFPLKSTSQLHAQTRSRFGGSSSAISYSSSSSDKYCGTQLGASTHGLKSLHLSDIGPRRFGSCKNFQMSAVSGGGSSGYGGSGDGKSGGGDGGSNSGGGDGGSNWSFLAW